MKKLLLIPYRERDKRFRLKKSYVVEVKKAKNSDLILPVPEDIIKAYHIEIGDVAVFEIINKNKFIVKFVKNTMYSFVENYWRLRT